MRENKNKDQKGVQIVSFDAQDNFLLEENHLREIFHQEEIKDLPVVVISVAGAFRKGKSFLLNFFIRYFKNNKREFKPKWFEKNETLEGFSWRGGKDPDTMGIVVWSEVFKVKVETGKYVAVVLIDTQGSFDNKSSVDRCAKIFAFSTLASSVQIYNLSQNIQEDNLQHLQIFTELGLIAKKENSDAPFQELIILVRDWQYSEDNVYGWIGGKELLDEYLKIESTQHEELQSIRKHIRTSFNSIKSFLMPAPGKKVSTSKNFQGKISEMDIEFTNHLKKFCESLLDSKNLVVKKIGNEILTVSDLYELLMKYADIFKSENLPKATTAYIAMVEFNLLNIANGFVKTYRENMNQITANNSRFLSNKELNQRHFDEKNRVIDLYNSKHKIGNSDVHLKYEEILMNNIENAFIDITQIYSFIRQNSWKGWFANKINKIAKTTAVVGGAVTGSGVVFGTIGAVAEFAAFAGVRAGLLAIFPPLGFTVICVSSLYGAVKFYKLWNTYKDT